MPETTNAMTETPESARAHAPHAPTAKLKIWLESHPVTDAKLAARLLTPVPLSRNSVYAEIIQLSLGLSSEQMDAAWTEIINS
jgi:hypothetical protein